MCFASVNAFAQLKEVRGVQTRVVRYYDTDRARELHGFEFKNENNYSVWVEAELCTNGYYYGGMDRPKAAGTYDTKSFTLQAGESYVWKVGDRMYWECGYVGGQYCDYYEEYYVKYKAYKADESYNGENNINNSDSYGNSNRYNNVSTQSNSYEARNNNNANIQNKTAGPKSRTIGGHEAVDLGLPSGILWATCNIGANSPEKAGEYYAGGEIKPKNKYEESNYNGIYTEYEKEYSWGKSTKRIIRAESDAAVINWGNGWRMPTEKETEELIDECDEIMVSTGYKIIGSNGNSIFLPFSGFYDENGLQKSEINSYFRSSSPNMVIELTPYGSYTSSAKWHIYNGFPIRPVHD